MKLLLTSFLLGFALSILIVGQQPSPTQEPKTPQSSQPQPARPGDDDVVRITTNLVQVDAVVTDKNGKVVNDLRPEEVEIYEDAKPQTITHFSFVSTSTPATNEVARKPDKNAPPLPPVPLRPEQVQRTVALVVDDLGLSFESAYQVRRALKKFVDEQVQPGDLVAIVRTASGVGALQQFTSDKRLLYAAVERVKWNPTGRGGIGAFAPVGGDLVRDPASVDQDLEEFREEIFAVGTLGAINYVIRGMQELPGRKSILLFSDGIRIYDRSDNSLTERTLMALRALSDRANRASVVIYTMDARGLQTLSLTAADSLKTDQDALSATGRNFVSGQTSVIDDLDQRLKNRRDNFFESQDGLNYLAQRTGGFFIHDTNDLAKGIQRVIEDQKSYYLIGYRPDESTFHEVSGRRAFHKLGLKILRPGKFSVRIRTGFYGVSDEEKRPVTETPRQRVFEALMSPFGASDVHVRLTSFFSNEAQLGSVTRSMLHVSAADLAFTDEPDGWHSATFDVLVFLYGDNGQVIEEAARTHTIRLRAETYERILKEGFVYNLTMPIRQAGAYQLRAALRDRTSERIGSASQFVEIPDVKKNRLVTSGIVARGMTIPAYKKLLSGTPPANQDDTVEEDTTAAASPALREFHRGMALVYAFSIYNSKIDKVTRKPALQIQTRLFRNGQQIFSGPPMPLEADLKDPKRLPVGGALQLGTDMQPGEYVLQVLVTDLMAKEKYRLASPWISFEIVD